MRVAQGGNGEYRTSRNLSQVTVTIQIKNGIYREKLVVPTHKNHGRLVGKSALGTIITGSDHTRDAVSYNTYSSQTVLVQANDFTAENITFENAAGPVGQAVALHIDGDRATFRYCRILGNQDTLYPAAASYRQPAHLLNNLYIIL